MSILKSAGVMGIATFFSRILGLVREQVFAYLFGAGNFTDAFVIAFRIPNLLRDLFAEGALSSALVPTYTSVVHNQGEEEGWKLANLVVNTLMLIVLPITLLGIFLSPELVTLFAKDFSNVDNKLGLTISLTRVMWPFFPLVSLAAVSMAILNSKGKFFIASFSPVLFNLASIFAGFFICPYMHYVGLEPIYGMAIGVVLGGVLQFLIQALPLRKMGFKYKLLIDFHNKDLRNMLMLMIPGLIGLGTTQLMIFVNSRLATSQGSGAVSWLNYSFRIMQFPIGVFGVSLASVMLQKVSKSVAANNLKEAGDSIIETLKHAININLSAAVGLSVLSVPIISVIYEHGRFHTQDTIQTANALICYSVGLVSYSAVKILVPPFFAIKKTRISVLISSLSVLLNVLVSIKLVKYFGFLGIALGTGFVTTLQMVCLFYFLSKFIKLDLNAILIHFAKSAVAALGVGVSAHFMYKLIQGLLTANNFHYKLFNNIFSLGFAIAMSGIVFILVCSALDLEEGKFFLSRFKRLLKRS